MTHRFTRIAFSLILASSLAACEGASPEPVEQDDTTPVASPAQEGEFCGGIAGIACADGLTCRYDGDYPDAGGTCVPADA